MNRRLGFLVAGIFALLGLGMSVSSLIIQTIRHHAASDATYAQQQTDRINTLQTEVDKLKSSSPTPSQPGSSPSPQPTTPPLGPPPPPVYPRGIVGRLFDFSASLGPRFSVPAPKPTPTPIPRPSPSPPCLVTVSATVGTLHANAALLCPP